MGSIKVGQSYFFASILSIYLHLLLMTFSLILSRLGRYYAYKRLLGMDLPNTYVVARTVIRF